MKKINRRQFLKGSAGMLSALGIPSYLIPKTAQALGAGGPKKLVLFFMNGGNDSMNMIVPTKTYATDNTTEIADGQLTEPKSQYDYYKALRPTIHLLKTGNPSGKNLLPLTEFDSTNYPNAHKLAISNNAVVSSPTSGAYPAGSVEFSLHPSLTGLRDIWDNGHLAIFPAAHCGAGANRSHFFQTEYFGHGLNTENSDQHGDGKGWVGRYFESKYGAPSADGIEGFDFESGYHPLMDGDIPVMASSNPANIDLGDDGDNIKQNTLDINTLRQSSASDIYNQYAAIQEALFARVDKLDSNIVDYTSPITYPNSSLGDRFRNAAALIKDDSSSNIGGEIEIINIDRSNFDTHGNQVNSDNSAEGSHAETLQDCSDSIKAFYDDMKQAGCGDDVVVVVQTEFGRTADENDGFGTDHARAACWMVIGGENSAGNNKNIHGGLYGAYPGIAFDVDDPANAGQKITDLDGGSRFYLHQTTDYRDILSEIIGDFLDNTVDEETPFHPENSVADYSRTAQGFIDT